MRDAVAIRKNHETGKWEVYSYTSVSWIVDDNLPPSFTFDDVKSYYHDRNLSVRFVPML